MDGAVVHSWGSFSLKEKVRALVGDSGGEGEGGGGPATTSSARLRGSMGAQRPESRSSTAVAGEGGDGGGAAGVC